MMRVCRSCSSEMELTIKRDKSSSCPGCGDVEEVCRVREEESLELRCVVRCDKKMLVAGSQTLVQLRHE